MGGGWKYAVVCSSNMNRSMEAHKVLMDNGYSDRVFSYGIGTHVRLPGPQGTPNIFEFGVPYQDIYQDLSKQDTDVYETTGLIQMLNRNVHIKKAPQRWQLETVRFDVVITFEERVFDVLVQDMHSRDTSYMMPMLIVNIETKDSHQDAATGGQEALEIVTMLENVEDLESEAVNFITEASARLRKPIMFTLLYT